MCLFQEEEVHDWYLLYGDSPGLRDGEEATALLTVVGLSQSVFGYPNEEAFCCDTRGDIGGGIYEVRGSRWLDNVKDYNERTYGSHHATWKLGGKYEDARHFFIGSQDVSAQFLAEGLRVEVFTDRPNKDVRTEALRRMERRHSERGSPPNEAQRVHVYPNDHD